MQKNVLARHWCCVHTLLVQKARITASLAPLVAQTMSWGLLGLCILLVQLACSDPSTLAVGDAGQSLDFDAANFDAANPGLRVQFIDPQSGPFSGGTEVTVRGNGFQENSDVYVGGRKVDTANLEYIDSRRIIILTPPGSPGLASVEVHNGVDVAALPQSFQYHPLAVQPPEGGVAGNTLISITGFGTNFSNDDLVYLDGVALTEVRVISELRIEGRTPPGSAGAADLRIERLGGSLEVDDAYRYLATADAFSGGMAGGPIAGEVNVVVLDANTKNGVDKAFVRIGDPHESDFQGQADALGQITFSDPALVGPISVVASAPGYEIAEFVDYDARDITVFLRKPPEPAPPGPPPSPPQGAFIWGHILFGDATGLGSPYWNLVPEPRHPDERKRVYVTTTASSVFANPREAIAIDYEGFDPVKTAWEFTVRTRASATAVVAIAGLFDANTSEFEPFAMGLARGVLVGPGETAMGIDLVVNVPLDSAALVELENPPALDTPGYPGPTEYSLKAFVDLGGEGVVRLSKHGLPNPAAPAPAANTYVFPAGSTSLVVPKMPALSGPLSDASYSFIAAAYSPGISAPFSVRIARGIGDIATPVGIGDFLGTPRALDPSDGVVATELSIEMAQEGPADGQATFHMHSFRNSFGDAILRMFARGSSLRAKLPKLVGTGELPIPDDEDLSWTMYSVRTFDHNFDAFNYRQLQAAYWEAYAAASLWVRFPEGLAE